jgi:hypothetical protein
MMNQHFFANADQSFHGSNQVLKQKSLGQAVMVSNFIDEVGGYLKSGGRGGEFIMSESTIVSFTRVNWGRGVYYDK